MAHLAPSDRPSATASPWAASQAGMQARRNPGGPDRREGVHTIPLTKMTRVFVCRCLRAPLPGRVLPFIAGQTGQRKTSPHP
ncbi:MAG: hypothetical protein MZV70_04895 [Desulfobacterales bacterium]|nr:hypothetical protein [Desulfobacterales bacterium]